MQLYFTQKQFNSLLEVFFYTLLIFLHLAGTLGQLVAALILVVFGLYDKQNLPKSMLMVCFAGNLNPMILSGGIPVYLRYLIYMVFFVKIVIDKFATENFELSPLTRISLLMVFTIFISSFFGQYPSLSIFKIFLFMWAAFIFFESSKDYLKNTDESLDSMFRAILISSFYFIDKPLINQIYKTSFSGFAGVFNHPQFYGGVLVVIFVFYFVKTITKGSWLYGTLSGLSGYSIFLTQARSALVASILAILFAIVVNAAQNTNLRKRIIQLMAKPYMYLTIVTITVLGGAVFAQNLYNSLTEFITKNRKGDSLSVLQNYQNTRGTLINMSIDNFIEFPIFGIGYGLSYPINEEGIVRSSFLYNIPISYSVEAGNLYLSLLGQTGLVGFLGFLCFAIVLYKNIISTKDLLALCFFVAIFLFNMSEACLLSVNGLGGIYIGLLAMSQKKIHTKNRHENKVGAFQKFPAH